MGFYCATRTSVLCCRHTNTSIKGCQGKMSMKKTKTKDYGSLDDDKHTRRVSGTTVHRGEVQSEYCTAIAVRQSQHARVPIPPPRSHYCTCPDEIQSFRVKDGGKRANEAGNAVAVKANHGMLLRAERGELPFHPFFLFLRVSEPN